MASFINTRSSLNCKVRICHTTLFNTPRHITLSIRSLHTQQRHIISLWLGGCAVSCTCNRGCTGRLGRYIAPCASWRRGSCHRPSQGDNVSARLVCSLTS